MKYLVQIEMYEDGEIRSSLATADEITAMIRENRDADFYKNLWVFDISQGGCPQDVELPEWQFGE